MQQRVKVKPNSKQQKIIEEEDGSLTIHLKSPPVDGKANQELIKVLSKKFDIPKSYIRIKSGASSRQKLIEVDMDE
ncbi:DUF167 domain-containing protein [Rivularia sp. UHCC 0363]|uniref:DUF167 domain-containing protein n=1 Tax=Rivularia sp. UHCC 0363 TaxID=3110244 RepID=UPI002B1F020D|nr:DUF167 domain-containing protein [Rivularia sp. UHCC 0363]MEA5596157.1 DUF167 domain-containing protein [Rivularia sp. UHCC 0363]